MGPGAWALAGMAIHGFFTVSAAVFMVGWMQDHEAIVTDDEYSEFYFATIVVLTCLSIFVIVLLPVLARLAIVERD